MAKRLPLSRRERYGYSRLSYILYELVSHLDKDPGAMPKVRVEALRTFAQSERDIANREYDRYHRAVIQYQDDNPEKMAP